MPPLRGLNTVHNHFTQGFTLRYQNAAPKGLYLGYTYSANITC